MPAGQKYKFFAYLVQLQTCVQYCGTYGRVQYSTELSRWYSRVFTFLQERCIIISQQYFCRFATYFTSSVPGTTTAS